MQVILTRIKGPIFSIADMIGAYNQKPLDKSSQRLTNFVIAGQQYCFIRIFYGVSIGPAAFSSFMSSIFKPINRENKIITYLNDVFIQDTTTKTMLQTFTQYHTILKNETSKPLQTNLSSFLTQLNF